MERFFELYPELTRSSDNLHMWGWEHWDLDFYIRVITDADILSDAAPCITNVLSLNTEDNPYAVERDQAKEYCKWQKAMNADSRLGGFGFDTTLLI